MTRSLTLCLCLLSSSFAITSSANTPAKTQKKDNPGSSLLFAGTQVSGQFTQGSMLIGSTKAGNKIHLNGKAIRVTPEGDFVLGFGRDAKLQQRLRITDAKGNAQESTLTLRKRDYRIQKIEGVPKRTVNPSAKSLDRIRKETAQVVKARKANSNHEFFLQAFQWPLVGIITGVYGSQRFYNGVPKRPHYGIDIAAPTGTPVVAPADGVISLTHPDMFFSGGTLIMDHGYGVSSTFIHLSKILVKVGDKVKQGQTIAEVGASGRATGPHLDWRMNWYKVRIDPATLVPPMPKPEK